MAQDDEEIPDPFCDPKNPISVPFDEVMFAHHRIRPGVMRTPCERSRLSDLYGIEIYVKREYLQYTGSFKERGARNTLLCLNSEERKKGVVSASAGNHAQAMSHHGRMLGIPVWVVMPIIAPIMKIQQCRILGAKVVIQGANLAESKRIAMKLAKNQGAMYINGYDHPDIIAGQGSIGLEILEQVPDVDVIVCPCGGGSLISGVCVAVKHANKTIKIIGTESEQCPGFTESMKAGRPTLVTARSSLADGLAVPLIGVNSFHTAQPHIDKMCPVSEASIALAILRLVETEKAVVEGAGATPLAAIIEGYLDSFKGKKVVCVASGGNIDTTVFRRVLERGLAADGRMIKLTVQIVDRPGGMSELIRMISGIGANIKEISQSRAWVMQDVFSVEVTLVCETADLNHTRELMQALGANYSTISFTSQ